ncbi:MULTISPECIES: polyprenyl synthetase family protein [unclassified Campylobacter]|uniref:polyprenyl synthetase family protein n=1 Tax=unclassified Campylobacter TaxID=2593542 RepID=UPI0012380B94|nr:MULTISPECIES: polyprenyl synthetase family protein [unclassified Campylobacter]KAA6225368.1 polyprenyl synthetase family protein [Campylobacter sp. LR185c]KAA6227064.1 polyprenyl synthetase family protein [Campylobacter sp. LR196d]KAA6227635.1 polyprenyl synthetase family protein [Campylobacter sp. LR286c]KAA6229500.1 polyprenyl synthetase family protein [Campylobacter sp. LR264d]KAA6230744.1 polyprenyl synthetase family protein [Campylobacter sp. LR291e]
MQEIDSLIESFLKDLNYPPILDMMKHTNSGKKLRSKLLLSIAKPSKKAFILCAVIELIHLASLLHDDIIDDSKLRRGVKSINAEFGVKNALMLGDILYAKAFFELSKIEAIFGQIISKAVSNLAIGELMDVSLSQTFNSDKKAYLDMIYNKTAVLIEASARCGAILENLNEEKFGEYGKNLGLAFQMIDDVLDVSGSSDKLGKPALNDFKEGKVTLPYIYLYESLEDKNKLKTLFKKEISEDEKNWLLKSIEKPLKKAVEEAKEYANLALNAIKEYKNEKLENIVKAMIDREF